LEAQQELHALERDMGLPFKVVPMFATQLQLQDFVDEVKVRLRSARAHLLNALVNNLTTLWREALGLPQHPFVNHPNLPTRIYARATPLRNHCVVPGHLPAGFPTYHSTPVPHPLCTACLQLSRSQIWLDGSTRAVPESRLTGDQEQLALVHFHNSLAAVPELRLTVDQEQNANVT